VECSRDLNLNLNLGLECGGEFGKELDVLVGLGEFACEFLDLVLRLWREGGIL
jgi:hypothetical protein